MRGFEKVSSCSSVFERKVAPGAPGVGLVVFESAFFWYIRGNDNENKLEPNVSIILYFVFNKRHIRRFK